METQYLKLYMEDIEQLGRYISRAVWSLREDIVKEIKMKPLLTLQEFADMLHVGIVLARDIVTSGKVRFLRVTPTMYRIRREDAEEYLKSIEGKPLEAPARRTYGKRQAREARP
jgi:hypothetical protein